VERIGGAVAHAGRGRDAACGKDEHGDGGSCGVCGGEGARIERTGCVCCWTRLGREDVHRTEGGTSDG
jgi:hypothetical protein